MVNTPSVVGTGPTDWDVTTLGVCACAMTALVKSSTVRAKRATMMYRGLDQLEAGDIGHAPVWTGTSEPLSRPSLCLELARSSHVCSWAVL
jgi:hypothetical protein